MKTENNDLNRIQYLIANCHDSTELVTELKSLKLITQDEMMYLMQNAGLEKEDLAMLESELYPAHIITLAEMIFIVDFLREGNYAIGWRDLSVSDLVNYGWLKLIEDV
jgi:hypothetical protein